MKNLNNYDTFFQIVKTKLVVINLHENMEVWPLKSGWLHCVFNTKMHLDKKPKQFICTANIFNVIFTLFSSRTPVAKALKVVIRKESDLFLKFFQFSIFYKSLNFLINLLALDNNYGIFFLIRLDQICPKWIKLDQIWISDQSKNVTI